MALVSAAELTWSQLGVALGCRSESGLLPESPVLGLRLKELLGMWSSPNRWKNCKRRSQARQTQSVPIVTATISVIRAGHMVQHNTGREARSFHALGVKYLLNNNWLDHVVLPPTLNHGENYQTSQLVAHWLALQPPWKENPHPTSTCACLQNT